MMRKGLQPCIRAYNNAIEKCQRLESAMKLFTTMLRYDGLLPNAHTFEILILKALVTNESAIAWVFYATMVDGGWVPSVDIYTALMKTMKDEPRKAFQFFWAMQYQGVTPNVETWNALIRNVRVWGPNSSRTLYDSMLILDVVPNADTHKAMSDAGCFGFDDWYPVPRR